MCDPGTSRPPWFFFTVLFVVSFGLNWPWEMVQMAAYAEMTGRSWAETAPRCTIASPGPRCGRVASLATHNAHPRRVMGSHVVAEDLA